MVRDLVVGLILSGVIGWVGHRCKLLSVSGAASVIVSTVLTFAWGGWVWGALALLVYLGSGLWSRYRVAYKESHLAGFRRSERGWRAVASRTGWSTALALFHILAPGAGGFFVAFVGALATVNADTWATELGLLNSRPPRLITTWRRVSVGTPGGISTLGTVAALGAAWLVGLAGLLLSVLAVRGSDDVWDRTLSWLPLAATLGGMAGSLVDSFLGATAQAVYYCERCDCETEGSTHNCGGTARQIRGWTWLTNEGVDSVSSIVGAAVAAGTFAWLAQSGR